VFAAREDLLVRLLDVAQVQYWVRFDVDRWDDVARVRAVRWEDVLLVVVVPQRFAVAFVPFLDRDRAADLLVPLVAQWVGSSVVAGVADDAGRLFPLLRASFPSRSGWGEEEFLFELLRGRFELGEQFALFVVGFLRGAFFGGRQQGEVVRFGFQV